MQLRHHVETASTACVWPPEAKDMSLDEAEKIVPPQLYDNYCLAWVVGATQEYVPDEHVPVSDNANRKLLSICLDILLMSHQGKLMTPKHYALGMAIRHMTSSSTVDLHRSSERLWALYEPYHSARTRHCPRRTTGQKE